MVNVRIKKGLLVRLKIAVKTFFMQNGSWDIIEINIISLQVSSCSQLACIIANIAC